MAEARGYLGPVGTFAQTAFGVLYPNHTGVPYRNIESALEAVTAGRAASVIVPVNNSIEGSVMDTLDIFLDDAKLRISHEIFIPISCVLAAHPGTAFTDVHTIATNPLAFQLCRNWLTEHLPNVTFLPTASAATAAVTMEKGLSDHHGIATLCSPAAASHNSLDVLVAGITDNSAPPARFVEVTQPGPPPAPTGHDTTSILVEHPAHGVRWMVDLLQEFATRELAVTRVHNRMATHAGACVAIDVDGHIASPDLQQALLGVHRRCQAVTFLGSYPRTPHTTTDTPHDTEPARTAAADWLASIVPPPAVQPHQQRSSPLSG